MALYAFDGTWNEDEEEATEETNVHKFLEAYEGTPFYLEGVGTRLGFIGKILGGLTGLGGRARIDEAMDFLQTRLDLGDEEIDIVGFSRGAALALHFANQVAEETGLPIRWLGLWDTVASFGLPGNDINIGWDLTLPDQVELCLHAMSLDERRGNFPLTRVKPGKGDTHPALEGRLREVWFRGVHSDVGGGNKNSGLSSIALVWMLRQAKERGLPISLDKIEEHEGQRDRGAPIRPSELDPKKDPFRMIYPTDVVHNSVEYRPVWDDVEHNNPPVALHVVDDRGQFLGPRFNPNPPAEGEAH